MEEKKEKRIIELLGITPGPWKSDKQENDFYQIQHSNGLVCLVGHFTAEKTKANSNLIAASPEMIEALIEDIMKAERNWLENNDFSFSPTEQSILEECHRLNKDKISIIQKATGKSWEEIKGLLNGK